MILMIRNLEYGLTAMLLVGAVAFELSNFPVGLLHEYAREISTATVRAGSFSPLPLAKAIPTELLLTAVD
jgi:plasmid stability protein